MENIRNKNQRYVIREELLSILEKNAVEILYLVDNPTTNETKAINQMANLIYMLVCGEMRALSIPPTAIGFVHPSLTPDGRFTYSFFPAEFNDHWRQQNEVSKP